MRTHFFAFTSLAFIKIQNHLPSSFPWDAWWMRHECCFMQYECNMNACECMILGWRRAFLINVVHRGRFLSILGAFEAPSPFFPLHCIIPHFYTCVHFRNAYGSPELYIRISYIMSELVTAMKRKSEAVTAVGLAWGVFKNTRVCCRLTPNKRIESSNTVFLPTQPTATPPNTLGPNPSPPRERPSPRTARAAGLLS